MFKRQYTAVPTTELEEGAGDSDLSSYESDSDDGDGDYSMDSLEEKTRGDASIATYKRMAIACGLVGGTMYLMLQAGAVIHHRVNGGGHGGGAGDLASSASQEAVATAASLVAVNATTPSPTPAPTPSPTPGPKCTLDDFVHGLWHQTEDAQEAKGYTYCKLDHTQDCRTFRDDQHAHKKYLHYEWKPSKTECKLQPIQPEKFKSCFRNKKIAFLGDSIAKNQQQALQCALLTEPEPGNTQFDGLHKRLYNSYYEEYKMNLDAIIGGWADFVDPVNVTSSTVGLEQYDVIVVSTGTEWRRVEESGIPVKSQLLVEQAVIERVEAMLKLPEHIHIIWRGPDLSHWSKAVDQNPEKQECSDGADGIRHDQTQLQILDALRNYANESPRFHFMDVFEITNMRSDAHPNDIKALTGGQHDCLTWCLPGVPDVWNQILYQYMCHHVEGFKAAA